MHVHAKSDRIASVLEGKGTFFALKNDGELFVRSLTPGDVVFFSRGTPHAFWGTETESLLLHVILNPFVEFDEPGHTIHSSEGALALENAGVL